MKIIGLVLSVFASSVFAFPEMVRHKYPHCISCHISANGGGVLTKYGRALSQEVLSIWGTSNENEAQFAYNVVPTPDWLDVLGTYRGIYAYQKTPFITQGKYIFMQEDVETSVHSEKFFLTGSAGYQNPPGAKTSSDRFISKTHYLSFRPTEEFSLRVGKFYPAFGIRTADHVIATKRDLGFDQGQETYNFEFAVFQPNWSLFLSAILGRFNLPKVNREEGLIATPSLQITDRSKLGVSFLYTQGNAVDKVVYGAWAILGFTPHFFLLTETDWQKTYQHGLASNHYEGFVNYQRLDYEIIQGLHLYLMDDYSQLNRHDASTLRNTYGAGLQIFPRPHFEINFAWLKKRQATVSSLYTDFAWFMLNFYL